MMERTTRVVIIGVGGLGGALARGLLAHGVPANRLTLCDQAVEKCRAIPGAAGATIQPDPMAAVAGGELVVLCVKPHDVVPLLDAISAKLTPGHTLVSVAAGITLPTLRRAMGAHGQLVRAMPNVNVAVAASTTSLVGEPEEPAAALELAEWLFGHVGTTVRLGQEKLMDAATALGASGPAFLAAVLEALADGGVQAGLPRAVAIQLALGMAEGTARHLREAALHPGALKDMVMSPGGTTAAGCLVLERGGVRGTLMATVDAAAARAKALAGG